MAIDMATAGVWVPAENDLIALYPYVIQTGPGAAAWGPTRPAARSRHGDTAPGGDAISTVSTLACRTQLSQHGAFVFAAMDWKRIEDESGVSLVSADLR